MWVLRSKSYSVFIFVSLYYFVKQRQRVRSEKFIRSRDKRQVSDAAFCHIALHTKKLGPQARFSAAAQSVNAELVVSRSLCCVTAVSRAET